MVFEFLQEFQQNKNGGYKKFTFCKTSIFGKHLNT